MELVLYSCAHYACVDLDVFCRCCSPPGVVRGALGGPESGVGVRGQQLPPATEVSLKQLNLPDSFLPSLGEGLGVGMKYRTCGPQCPSGTGSLLDLPVRTDTKVGGSGGCGGCSDPVHLVRCDSCGMPLESCRCVAGIDY